MKIDVKFAEITYAYQWLHFEQSIVKGKKKTENSRVVQDMFLLVAAHNSPSKQIAIAYSCMSFNPIKLLYSIQRCNRVEH